jgi:hypothetical protein
LTKIDKQFSVGLALTILSIFLAFYLSAESTKTSIKISEEALNKTFLMAIPVTLEVKGTVNEIEGRWYINITNTHPLKETGKIYIYKLEINPDKPGMQLNRSLKPRESDLLSLTIKSKKENISFLQKIEPFSYSWTLPASEVYYVNEHVSISVRITCDTCSSQGVILRVPDFNEIPINMVMTNRSIQTMNINTYEWLDYNLQDILLNQSNKNG